MVMVEVAPCAAMTMVMALPRRDHGRQHLPQPIVCSLYCLHSIMLIHSIAVKNCLSEPDASQGWVCHMIHVPARLCCSVYCIKYQAKAREV